MENNNLTKSDEMQPPIPYPRRRMILNIFVSLAVIFIGILGAVYIHKSTPKAHKRTPVKMVPLVKVVTLFPENKNVIVSSMGTVIPAHEIVLKSEVSGEIISVHPEFTLGGFIQKKAKILAIDPEDYKLAIAHKKSAIASAEYALKLEMGHQEIAKREWQLLNSNPSKNVLDDELALRRPHMAKAKANLDSATAELAQAKLNLERTIIEAPFNAVVRSKSVDTGSQVSTQDKLAELIATDEYWIQLPIQIERLKWIQIPRNKMDKGSTVRIFYQNGYEREGKVARLLADLEPRGRMARILVSVKDPLDLKLPDPIRPPLLIGEYVRVEIQGKRIENIFSIPRKALKDDTKIWILGDGNRLKIRKIETAWRGPHTVFIKEGINEGDRLIISELPGPVDGMTVEVDDSNPEEK